MTILDITGKLPSAINARRVVLNLLFSFSLSVFYTFLTDDAHPIHKLQKKKKQDRKVDWEHKDRRKEAESKTKSREKNIEEYIEKRKWVMDVKAKSGRDKAKTDQC